MVSPCENWLQFNKKLLSIVAFFMLSALFCRANVSHAASVEAATAEMTNGDVASGLIVKFEKRYVERSARLASASGRAAMLTETALRQSGRDVQLRFSRELATAAELHEFDRALPRSEAEALARAVAATPGVAYATPNRVMRTQAVPLDREYARQWGFRLNPQEQGANFEAAWDITRGSANQTIGVIDSGVARSHPELAGQLRNHPTFPFGGYDFIKNSALAGDGDGRDLSPEQSLNSCGHGSHVAGTIAAQTKFTGGGTGVGVAGGAPLSKVLMARGLDFSGDEADIVDAMLWLGGLPVPALASNPHPVRVINMSLGGTGGCGGAYQDAVDRLAEVGALVVAAAGNNTDNVSNFAPANCVGVAAVAASDVNGNRAGFSNFGNGVTITAPGDGIWSTGGGTGGNCFKSGTSMAAPHVTASVALLQTLVPTLSANQTVFALRSSARGFPSGSNCLSGGCGAGLLDARRALDLVSPGAASTVGWTSGAQSVRENDGEVRLALARIGGTANATTVEVQALGGTALEPLDFGAPSSNVVTWAAGEVADKTVAIPINYRTGEQGARSFSVRLINTSGGVLANPIDVPIRITEVDCDTVTPIAIGDRVTGTLGVAPNVYCRGGVRGPEHNTVRYSFAATAGQIVTVSLESTTAGPAVLDPYAYLLDSNLRVIAENDDIVAGSQRNALINAFVIPATGTYYIDATTWSATADKSGTFALTLATCGPYIGSASCNVDADGDNVFDTSDALIILRRMLGYADAALTDSTGYRVCALRTSANTLSDFIDAQIVASPPALAAYDFDGDGQVLAATDGLLLLRAVLRLPASAVVAGTIGPGAQRANWNTLRSYLTDSCRLNALPPPTPP
jgi:subtilisin family serine protease